MASRSHLDDDDDFGGDYAGNHSGRSISAEKRTFGDLDEEEEDVFGAKKAKKNIEESGPGATTGMILSLRESLQNCKDDYATCQVELEAAREEIQKWHSAFHNGPALPSGASSEPGLVVNYLQSLKSSEDSLKEQLEKAKKREAAFIVTFAKRDQEVADLKAAVRDLKKQLQPPSMQKMGSQRKKRLSASWDTSNVMLFCDICIKEIEVGNRPTTYFNKDGWKNLIMKFNEGSGKFYGRAQLKNKWDQMKKDWKIWKELNRNETCWGWNSIKRTIDAPDEWWAEKLQVIPNAKKFRYAGIPPKLEEKLDKMFSSVIATGEDDWKPSSRVVPSDGMSEHIVSNDVDNMTTNNVAHGSRSDGGHMMNNQSVGESSTQQSKRSNNQKSKSKSTTESQLMNYIKELVGIVREETPPSRLSTIKEAFEEFEKIPQIFNDLNFYNFSTEFVLDKNKREAFMSCPADRKVWWLRIRYNKSLE